MKTQIYIEVWSRDCDMCESTQVYAFESREELQKWKDEIPDWAEGPVSVKEITKEEYDDFEPYFRDRIMEAYENGRGTSTYV